VQKTGRLLIVEEGPKTGGVGAELAAGIAERWPSVRILRVASPDVPVPFTPVLESAYRPDGHRIVEAAKELQ
jgi:pyruvate/2-oxoglutarate/acetoin dehydrogenase E1 component